MGPKLVESLQHALELTWCDNLADGLSMSYLDQQKIIHKHINNSTLHIDKSIINFHYSCFHQNYNRRLCWICTWAMLGVNIAGLPVRHIYSNNNYYLLNQNVPHGDQHD